MKQFYKLYKDNEKVSTLVTQLGWTNHFKDCNRTLKFYQDMFGFQFPKDNNGNMVLS